MCLPTKVPLETRLQTHYKNILVVLSILFCILATVILHNDVLLGIEATYGTFAVLLLLSGLFSLVVLIISKMPIPEHMNVKQILVVLLGAAVSVLVFLVLPVFGLFMLAASLLGIGVVLMPLSWKVSAKMALRNLGRRRTRAMTTMLALFIGIFCIGLVVGLGQDLQTGIADSFTQNMHLKLGDTVTLLSADRKTTKTVTIVGIYASNDSFATVGSVIASTDLVSALSSPQSGVVTVFYLKIDPAQANHALDTLGQLVPNASVQNLVDVGAGFAQQLSSLLQMLVAIASLSVIAAVIIIANAVALAMLERRRELGILKSVGYTSSTVLSEVIVENGVVGGVGAFMATLLAAAAIALLGNMLFTQTFTLDPVVVVSLVIGSALLAMLTAALVSWRAVRVRPLEVLRYE